MKHSRGLLFVCEGIDGSGKTTLAHALVKHYSNLYNQPVIYTQQPGGTELGKRIRAIIKEYYSDSHKFSLTEFLLFAADRAQHIKEIISPQLEKGSWIICDRFCDSSLIYQGFLQNTSLNFINDVHKHILDSIKPTLTLYCRVSAEVAQERITRRLGKDKDTFDLAEKNIREKIIAGFDQLYSKKNDSFIILDANQSPENLLKDACNALDKKICEICI